MSNQKKVIVVKRKNTSNPSLPIQENIITSNNNNNTNSRNVNNATFTRKTPGQDKKAEEPTPVNTPEPPTQPTQIQEAIAEEQKIKNEIDKNIMEQQKREGNKIPARVNRIMIRGIPANITDEDYAKIMEQYLQKSDHHYFIRGSIDGDDILLGRAYLNFPTKSEAQSFLQQSQPLFKDSNSKDVPNQISFAPLQKLPPNEARPDELENTLDKDPEFLSFLEESQKPVENRVSLETIMKERTKVLEQRKEQGANMTPLVKYIIEERDKEREKEKDRVHRERREKEKERRSRMRKDSEKKLVILKRAERDNNSDVIYSSQSSNTSTKEVIIKEGKKIITIKKKNL